MEKTGRTIALVHFFLMFGYKLFSLYFPLFLLEKHFTIPQVGYSTFFIYLPIALAAPVAGFLNYRVNSATLAAIGILGYGIYSLGMIMFPALWIFYLLQIMLGISAALFFVSTRVVLMNTKPENANRTFAWFYVANSYAAAIAPLAGALLIFKFGFTAAFVASFCIQVFAAGFCFSALRNRIGFTSSPISVKSSAKNYNQVLQTINKKHVLPFIVLAFLLLVFDNGFTGTFVVLFLKHLGWSQNLILFFNAALALLFLPISALLIKAISHLGSQANIRLGSAITGLSYIVLGSFSGVLNFSGIFAILMGDAIGGLMAGSGRSGLMTTKLKEYPKESAAIDTVFSPFSTAIGGLFGGLAIAAFGYPAIFIVGGCIIVGAGLLMPSLGQKKEPDRLR